MVCGLCFFEAYGDHRDLHVLTHSFPTRRSSDLNVFGAMGLSRELGLEQLYRDVRMLVVPDGTSEILTLIQGRQLTGFDPFRPAARSEEHTSELQSLMRISYAVFCLKKNKINI